MARSVSATLETEFDSKFRSLAFKVTVERFFPDWTVEASGLSASEKERYAHGHAVVVAKNANGSGGDIVFRARSASFSAPDNGRLYVQVKKGTGLDSPDWTAGWVDTYSNIGDYVAHSAWISSYGLDGQGDSNTRYDELGGSISVVWNGNTTTPQFRVFFFQRNGSNNNDWRLWKADFDSSGSYIASSKVAISDNLAANDSRFGTLDAKMSHMQCAALDWDNVYLTSGHLVETADSEAAWHKDVYGSTVRHYQYSGGWSEVTLTDAGQVQSYFTRDCLTHAECGLVH